MQKPKSLEKSIMLGRKEEDDQQQGGFTLLQWQ